MKNLLFVLSLMMVTVSFAQKPCKLTVNYKFSNIQEGYDHKTKTQVYLDGSMIGESSEHAQSKATTIKLAASKGKHNVKIVNMTYYEGKWEERSIANGYSTEGTYEEDMFLGKKKSITIEFDLNQAEPVISVK